MARPAGAEAVTRRSRAIELVGRAGPASGPGAEQMIDALERLDAAAAEAADAVVSEPAEAEARCAEIVRRGAEATGWEAEAFRLALADRLTQGAWLTEYAPAEALEAMLRALVALTSVSAASLWSRDATGRVELLAAAGPIGKRAKQEARRLLLSEERRELESGQLRIVPVLRWSQVVAALALNLRAAGDPDALAAAARAASSAGALIERQRQLEAGEAREALLRAAADRRFARLALDVHDGPLQDVAALLGDVRLYREQLLRTLGTLPNGRLLAARTDDFEARLIAIDRELRGLAQSFEAPSLLAQPLAEVIDAEAEALRRRTGIAVGVDVGLETEGMTQSQQICLIRLVQETLSNVRDHSSARHVRVRLAHHDGHYHMLVEDDGVGFDVERTLVRVARQGRLGLVGMAERVRLLGGVFDIESGPGKGTLVTAVLPEFSPADAPSAEL